MRSHLLLTTTALSLVLAVGSAQAQSRPDRNDMKNDRPSAQSQMQNERAKSADKSRSKETTGQAQQSPAANSKDEKNASDNNQKADQGSGRSRTQAAPSKADNDRARTSGEDNKSAAEQNNKQQPAAAQNNKQPDQSQQPKSAAGQNSKQPASAQKQPAKNEPERNQAKGRQNNNEAQGQRNNNEANRNEPNNQRSASQQPQRNERLSASLKVEQKTRLTQAVARVNVKPVTNVNFSVSVGTVVPTTVVLHPVPAEFVEIIPQYRGYDFFMVRDEIVIVEPQSHHIVDVIERGGGPARAEATTTKRKVELSNQQREVIRKHTRHHVTTGASTRTETHITVGEELPQSVEIQTFPDEVYREVPTIRTYRYIQSGPNVYLVEPHSRRVIEEIE